MTCYEKTLLRKWVIAGHSPLEAPPSMYLCLTGSESYDFLDIYRMDKEIRKAMKGMNEAQQKAYLMEYMGWTDYEPVQEDADFWEPAEWEKEQPFEQYE